LECRSVPTETVGRRHRWSPSKPLETCRCHQVAQRSSHRRQLGGPWAAARGEMYNVSATWEALGKRGMKKWTLARRSQGPINISVCICIDQMCRLTVAIYPIVYHCLALTTFQWFLCRNLELARLVTDPRDARRRLSALFSQIRFTGPLQLTRLGMSILSLYCTSYACECIRCDRRDFLFGRTIIDTERHGGEVQ
jgi:hypothetical protein